VAFSCGLVSPAMTDLRPLPVCLILVSFVVFTASMLKSVLLCAQEHRINLFYLRFFKDEIDPLLCFRLERNWSFSCKVYGIIM
jgi:hypothetical protein